LAENEVLVTKIRTILKQKFYVVLNNICFPYFTRKWLNHAKSLCSQKDIKIFGLDNLDAEINMLRELLSKGHQEIGFCHNDLQYGNIMMDEETRSITLIVSYLSKL
jgi:thiamine kinase-like enzyme